MRNGAYTLGDLLGRIEFLEIVCSRCPRKGRLKVSRLIADMGSDQVIPSLHHRIAPDCPKRQSFNIHDRCGVHYPQLQEIFAPTDGISPFLNHPGGRLQGRDRSPAQILARDG